MEEKKKVKKEEKERIILKKTADLMKIKIDRLMSNPVRGGLYRGWLYALYEDGFMHCMWLVL